MKVFVAAEATSEKSDFSWTVPGELVHLPPVVCDCPDCGCQRAMGGFVSHKGTTCFMVSDLGIDEAAYIQLLWDTLEAGGWVAEDSAEDRAWIEEWGREHLALAADFPIEEPLRIRDGRIRIRGAGRAL